MGAENSLFKKCSIDSEVQYKCKDYTLLTGKYDSNKFSIFLFNDNNFAFDIKVCIISSYVHSIVLNCFS